MILLAGWCGSPAEHRHFARRCRISRSALRFYDQCGLLRPASVDQQSSYRRYSESQLEEADLIRRLQAADLGVADLRRFLAADLIERRLLLNTHLASATRHWESVRQAREEPESIRRAQVIRTIGAAGGHPVVVSVGEDDASNSQLEALFTEQREAEWRELLGDCRKSRRT